MADGEGEEVVVVGSGVDDAWEICRRMNARN